MLFRSSYTCGITNVYGGTNTATATLTLGGQFASTVLPEIGGRDRHTAIGSDGTNLFFTLGNTANAAFYRIPEGAATGWATLAPIPLSPTVNNDSGVGDMAYFGGSLWTLARNDSGGGTRSVLCYDKATDTWTMGAPLTSGDPNAGIVVVDTDKIYGGWIGWDQFVNITDWQAGGSTKVVNLGGGAAHPWYACVGPDNAYFLKHYNVATTAGVLASINKVGTPANTNIAGLPFNPGMGCAIEYLPGTLFTNDNHARLYVLRGGTGTGDNDGGSWTSATSVDQLAIYDLVTKTWELQTLPFAVDDGSEMCLGNQTLYILAANSDAQPLKMLYLGPPVTPTIMQQPVSQTIFLGQSATFSVSVSGGGPYGYQWRHGTNTILGDNSASYTVAVASYPDSGNYSVVVTNAAGSVTSQAATLSVLSLPMFANLTNSLVLHLTFDRDFVTDSSSRGNNAIVGGSPSPVPGKLGNAVQLSTDVGGGTYNFLQVYDPNSDFQLEATNSFTIAFWLKCTNSFSDLPIIGNAIGSTYNAGFVLTESGNRFEWTLTGSDTGQVAADPAGGPLLTNGTWHQVTLVVDRDTQVARSYVDGVLIDSRSVGAVGSLITGNVLCIGQDPSGAYPTTPTFSGAFDLDDLGIWRRALSPTEAESIYLVGQNHGNSFDSTGSVTITIQKSGANLELIWETGTLQESIDLQNWSDVTGPSYYLVTPTEAKKFFRVRQF